MGALDPTIRLHKQFEYALGGRAADSAIAELAASVGLPTEKSVLRRYPHELSGGMAQRAVIAKAIAARPSIVVADEPTASLDAAMRTQVLELLVSLRSDLGLTCVLLSHDLGLVLRYCDRIAVMYSGRVVELGTPDMVLSRPAHPYTKALLRAAPGREAPGSRVEPIPGMQTAVRERSERCAFADRCGRAEARCDTVRPIARVVDGRQVLCHFAEEEVMVGNG
jgi:oligopeptide/dipeptide ABC transporter ATP-binding protein